jgi:hypothetical protein
VNAELGLAMRADMAKVIVERPRLGGGVRRPKGNRKRARLALADQLPMREGIKRQWQSWRKSLNEHLGPLRRYLQSQVGRPWNKVHSEISQHLRLDSAVQSHVLDHLDDYVAKHVEEIDGELYSWSGYSVGHRLRSPFYVCPRTGLLRENKQYRDGKRQRKKLQLPTDRVEIDAWHHYCRIGGVWYEVCLKPLNQEAIGRWDVVLKTRVDWQLMSELRERYGLPAFAVSKRQLNKREVVRVLNVLAMRQRAAARAR